MSPKSSTDENDFALSFFLKKLEIFRDVCHGNFPRNPIKPFFETAAIAEMITSSPENRRDNFNHTAIGALIAG